MRGNLRARVARLKARVDRARPDGPLDRMSEDDLDRILRALGSDFVREFAGDAPEWREAIARLEEWEATTPGWWLEGPPGQKRWQHGVRRRTEDGGWRVT